MYFFGKVRAPFSYRSPAATDDPSRLCPAPPPRAAVPARRARCGPSAGAVTRLRHRGGGRSCRKRRCRAAGRAKRRPRFRAVPTVLLATPPPCSPYFAWSNCDTTAVGVEGLQESVDGSPGFDRRRGAPSPARLLIPSLTLVDARVGAASRSRGHRAVRGDMDLDFVTRVDLVDRGFGFLAARRAGPALRHRLVQARRLGAADGRVATAWRSWRLPAREDGESRGGRDNRYNHVYTPLWEAKRYCGWPVSASASILTPSWTDPRLDVDGALRSSVRPSAFVSTGTSTFVAVTFTPHLEPRSPRSALDTHSFMPCTF